MRTITQLTPLLLPLTLAACGSAPPPADLVHAREAMQRAESGPAKEAAPAQLHDARKALSTANARFESDGDSIETQDQAQVALLKAGQAEAYARMKLAQREREATQKRAGSLTVERLNRSEKALAENKATLEKTKEQLERERIARAEAEKRAAAAMADLQKIANVKQESRGTVITLSGGVLFGSNQASLLPGAMVKLNEVADALIKGNPDATMTVEGHTDSQGKQAHNRELSQKRADAVREYLISRGIAADRVKATGVASDRPVADNNSAEGRANNRRVEIVVGPSP